MSKRGELAAAARGLSTLAVIAVVVLVVILGLGVLLLLSPVLVPLGMLADRRERRRRDEERAAFAAWRAALPPTPWLAYTSATSQRRLVEQVLLPHLGARVRAVRLGDSREPDADHAWRLLRAIQGVRFPMLVMASAPGCPAVSLRPAWDARRRRAMTDADVAAAADRALEELSELAAVAAPSSASGPGHDAVTARGTSPS